MFTLEVKVLKSKIEGNKKVQEIKINFFYKFKGNNVILMKKNHERKSFFSANNILILLNEICFFF